jgi:hypothetical protein
MRRSRALCTVAAPHHAGAASVLNALGPILPARPAIGREGVGCPAGHAAGRPSVPLFARTPTTCCRSSVQRTSVGTDEADVRERTTRGAARRPRRHPSRPVALVEQFAVCARGPGFAPRLSRAARPRRWRSASAEAAGCSAAAGVCGRTVPQETRELLPHRHRAALRALLIRVLDETTNEHLEGVAAVATDEVVLSHGLPFFRSAVGWHSQRLDPIARRWASLSSATSMLCATRPCSRRMLMTVARIRSSAWMMRVSASE